MEIAEYKPFQFKMTLGAGQIQCLSETNLSESLRIATAASTAAQNSYKNISAFESCIMSFIHDLRQITKLC